ncbi:DEAD/DEAH box helicase family protein [Candidatus Gracilibacteria bacterium]|nr:DEAD/DEAH box helicase family protein [Candidatus Gracilibacteria bacterium]
MHFSEADTRHKFIDSQLERDGWQKNQIICEFDFTDGRKLPGNKRGERKKADYILSYKGVKLAIIEAKKYSKEPTEGLEQAKQYAKILNIRFVFSTNGQKIYQFDMQTGFGGFVENYPEPEKLYEMVFGTENITKNILLQQNYFVSDKKLRYYQEIAIQKTMEAIAEGKNRILLNLATGTGKTVIAFQICYKLFEAKWSLDRIGKRRPKILFLADRNVLVDQAMNTFNYFEKDYKKINGKEIKKRGGEVPKNANFFFAIYQALTGGNLSDDDGQEEILEEKYFEKYEKDFFDAIIIDECHRGGAKEDGNWAEILKYFDSAVQIGMTATPKREENRDTYKYFGKPVYEYSLKSGIDDGFLTPFKIKRIKLNIDEFVLQSSDTIVSGEVRKNIYDVKDMDKNIILEERSDLIAEMILNQINKFDKTIIFCVDQGHALRMRDAINKYKTVTDPDYCVRVTSDEGEIGRNFLERFQDNDANIPVILTSSQMLTTGVDAKNVRNIVLVRNIGSIVEYKQIVGRGTRVFDGKDFFTIYDFVGSSIRFIDEIWEGPADNIEEINEKEAKTKKEKIENIDEVEPIENPLEEKPKEKLVVILGENREVKVIDIETYYMDPASGRLLSTEDFLKKLFSELPKLYENEHQLRITWADPDKREELLRKLASLGFDKEQFAALKKMFCAEKSDIFDILSYISYETEIKNRKQRSVFGKHFASNYTNPEAKEFLEFLTDLYENNGILDFAKEKLTAKVDLFGHGTTMEIAEQFGGPNELVKAYYGIQKALYEVGSEV